MILPDTKLDVNDFPFEEPEEGVSDLTKLCLMYFHPFRNENLEAIIWTPSQLKIIDAIINRSYNGKKRIHIMCSTQYGKSSSVAAGTLIRVALMPEKWAIVSGTGRQSRIIMQYIINFATDNPLFSQELEIEKGALEKLRRERSKNVLTFKKGGRVEVFSAEIREGGKGSSGSRGMTGVMGQGSPNVICDEAGLIPDPKFTLIMRMLGGHKDNFLIKIGNPFERNHFLTSSKSSYYAKIIVDYKQALKEGRYTREYIKEMQETDPEMFKVLYECKFPDEGALLEGKWRPLFTTDRIKEFIEKPGEELGLEFGTKILGVDLAGEGFNYNVGVIRTRNYARVLFKKRKVKVPFLANYILDQIEEEKINPFNVNLDKQGVGHGLHQILSVRGIQGTNVGVSARDNVTFANLRAELIYRFYQWLNGGGRLSVANYKDWFELSRIYVRTRNGKLLIMSKAEAQARGIESPDTIDATILTFADCVSCVDDDSPNPKSQSKEDKPPSAMSV